MKHLALLLTAGTALATNTGTLEGNAVDDSTGKPLAGASVVLWQQGRPTEYGTATDAGGRYQIVNIPAGRYDAECSFMGYFGDRVTNLSIIPNKTEVVDFRLCTYVPDPGIEVQVRAWRGRPSPRHEEPQRRQPDSLRLELAFDGEVPYEYNRWLKENRREFPRLWPVLIVLDSSVYKDTVASYYVSFYDETGNTKAHRRYSGLRRAHWQPGGGRWFDVEVAPQADRLLIIDHRDVWSSQDILTTMLDAHEDTVFVSDGGGLKYANGPLYFREYFDEEANQERDYFEVLDDSGRVLNRISLLGFVGCIEAARNGSHAMRVGDHAVVVDKKGQVIWLDTIPGICEANIENNGLAAAGLNLTWMRVKNFTTGEVFEAYLPGLEGRRYAKPDVAVARRGGGFMVHRPNANVHSQGVDIFYTGDCQQVGQPVASIGGVVREAYYGGGIGLMVFEVNRLVVARPDWPVEVHEEIGFAESQAVLDANMVAFIGTKRAMVYRIGAHE
jgi:hypothetical protein